MHVKQIRTNAYVCTYWPDDAYTFTGTYFEVYYKMNTWYMKMDGRRAGNNVLDSRAIKW